MISVASSLTRLYKKKKKKRPNKYHFCSRSFLASSLNNLSSIEVCISLILVEPYIFVFFSVLFCPHLASLISLVEGQVGRDSVWPPQTQEGQVHRVFASFIFYSGITEEESLFCVCSTPWPPKTTQTKALVKKEKGCSSSRNSQTVPSSQDIKSDSVQLCKKGCHRITASAFSALWLWCGDGTKQQ